VTGLEEVRISEVARVEGHGGVYVEIDREAGEVKRVELRIFEGSRLFEAAATGRGIEELPMVMSRICGICGPAHAVCAAKAIEAALGAHVPSNVKDLREAVVALNTVESHLLHVVLLSLPDFLGARSFIELMPAHRETLMTALRIREAVGRALDLLCGERVHARNIVPGGFAGLPSKEAALKCAAELREAAKSLERIAEELAGPLSVALGGCESEHYAALSTGVDYSLTRGDVVIDGRVRVPEASFRSFFVEVVVPYSTSKKGLLHTMESYMVGALARLNVNEGYLSASSKELLKVSGVSLPSRNPYLIPLAQLAECLTLLERAAEALETAPLKPGRVRVRPKAGVGVGVIEAPRGLLYHYYAVSEAGLVVSADVSTPTAQNVADMERNIKRLVERLLADGVSREVMERECAKLVRCYDPCISCSVHIVQARAGRSKS